MMHETGKTSNSKWGTNDPNKGASSFDTKEKDDQHDSRKRRDRNKKLSKSRDEKSPPKPHQLNRH